jgi:uncharacterized protein
MKKNYTLLAFFFLTFSLIAQSYVPEKNNLKIKAPTKVPIQAYAFNLKKVKLLEGSPFKKAMDLDAAYLLDIKPDRLLHRFHKHAGLPTKDSLYGGWEDSGLSGHTLGHYLSACAMMYVSTDNMEFKKRVDYIVDELERCQLARKTGYIGAVEKEDTIFGKLAKGDINSKGFDLNGGWSPFYVVHKNMAGLVDAYLYCDNEKAVKLVTFFADWVENTVKSLNEEQLEKMLTCEYGGMNDVLTAVYAITGHKKYLNLSYKFHDKFVLGKLAEKIDPMPGKHSNTNVPKATGCALRYVFTGDEKDKTIAQFFWNSIVRDHTYVIGGNSNYEYCGDPKKLNDRLSDNTCETCNTYNMLKLTRHLFSQNPNSELGDYYERALYNHILASQNPEDGMMCYFVPLRMGTKKEFSERFNTFTCCVGSGIENHSKYAESIYYEGKKGDLFVNLFIPSVLNWSERGITLRQETAFPESNETNFTFQCAKKTALAVNIRNPAWAKGDVSVFINGKKMDFIKTSNGYFTINRKWKNGDKMQVRFGMSLNFETMPDNPNRIAFLYGPIVLAGQLGKEMPDPIYGTPVLLTDNRQISDWIKPVSNEKLAFDIKEVGKPMSPKLIPFYKTYNQFYSVYWDYFTPKDFENRQKEYETAKRLQKELDDKTIDIMRFEMQPERDHHLKVEGESYTSDALGRMGREVRKGGFMEFDMKADPSVSQALLCSYIGDDKNSVFDLQIDGVKIATQELKGGKTGRFFDEQYLIPADLIRGKTRVVVRVQAAVGKTAGRVFGCRIVKL